jgi:hypothetical protein
MGNIVVPGFAAALLCMKVGPVLVLIGLAGLAIVDEMKAHRVTA